MSLLELKDLIYRFNQQKDNTPISLIDNEHRICGTQEILNLSRGELFIFVFFDENQNSKLFDVLSNENVFLKILNRSINSTINILTNNTAKIKNLGFLSGIGSNSKINIQAIPNKLSSKIIEDTLDNEFILSSPSNILFIDRYAESKIRLPESTSFLTLHDDDFFNALKSYFLRVEDRAKAGEFR
ncbi:hypothetical protein [Aeromonas sp. R4-2]|uniref:hypothetical protein n=1 Tax=Aeromonas TaxID=642 RepID=UPI0034A5AA36